MSLLFQMRRLSLRFRDLPRIRHLAIKLSLESRLASRGPEALLSPAAVSAGCPVHASLPCRRLSWQREAGFLSLVRAPFQPLALGRGCLCSPSVGTVMVVSTRCFLKPAVQWSVKKLSVVNDGNPAFE